MPNTYWYRFVGICPFEPCRQRSQLVDFRSNAMCEHYHRMPRMQDKHNCVASGTEYGQLHHEADVFCTHILVRCYSHRIRNAAISNIKKKYKSTWTNAPNWPYLGTLAPIFTNFLLSSWRLWNGSCILVWRWWISGIGIFSVHSEFIFDCLQINGIC